MPKIENVITIFLGVLVMCLCTVIFVMLVKFAKQEGEGNHQRRENQKAALLLREEREKMQKLLKTLEEINGREP